MSATHLAAIGALVPLLLQAGPSQIQIANRRARALQPGEAILFTLAAPAAAGDVQIQAFDRTIPAFKTGDTAWQAIVGIDLEQRPGRYLVTAGSDRVTLVVRSKQFPTRVLHVAPEYVNPPRDVETRIQEEAGFLDSLWLHSADERLWEGPFTRPVEQPATSSFGSRSVFNGQLRSPHAGADFPSPEGTPVRAPNAGRIVAARDFFFTGNTVIIDHGLGIFSTLAHLSRLDVAEGDLVDAAQTVGLSGATGRVTGPHLHWALRIGRARVDPVSLLAVLGSSPEAK